MVQFSVYSSTSWVPPGKYKRGISPKGQNRQRYSHFKVSFHLMPRLRKTHKIVKLDFLFAPKNGRFLKRI